MECYLGMSFLNYYEGHYSLVYMRVLDSTRIRTPPTRIVTRVYSTPPPPPFPESSYSS